MTLLRTAIGWRQSSPGRHPIRAPARAQWRNFNGGYVGQHRILPLHHCMLSQIVPIPACLVKRGETWPSLV
jgi:hypothetical protein